MGRGNIADRFGKKLLQFGLAFGLLSQGTTARADAQSFDPNPDACPSGIVAGVMLSAVGDVRIDNATVAPGTTVCADSVIQTGTAARAAFRLIGADSPMRLRENSQITLPAPTDGGSSVIDIIAGWLYVLGKPRRDYQINTPFTTAGIEGTEFAVRVENGRTEIYLFEGEIRATGGAEFPQLTAGSRLIVAADGAVQVEPLDQSAGTYVPLKTASRDVVAWTLYYPDVLGKNADPAIRDAAALLAAGSPDAAKATLSSLPANPARAGLEAVIALAQEDIDAAEAALAGAAETATTLLARTYVLQARFELDAARDAAQTATAAEPDNALAFARLAELELMLGDRSASRTAAEQASALAQASGADIPRTAIVEGFTALAERRAGRAERRFADALAADSQNPLAWLGRGLVQILQGNIIDGRESLEAAILHDPNNALIRAYLGKAYFEERRTLDAETQYAMAKDLDPLDPTADFYDAILKQLDNRPIEALFALDKAIAKNDNRAVYRSRLLLDEDRAARNASLARIYDELGLEQPAIGIAARSLADNPADHSAHRFLADIFARKPGLDIARASALLQAQMLQPLSLNAVQPSARFPDLNLIASSGPAEAGFNEFNALFERDRVQATISALAGDNNTLGGEGVIAAKQDWAAVSAGLFDYRTDGYRPNNDVSHTIRNLFLQTEISPRLTLQFEARHRDTEQGDIEEQFDPDFFDAGERREITETGGRIGANLELGEGKNLLASVNVNRRDEIILNDDGFFVGDIDNEVDDTLAELQYLWNSPNLALQVGGSWQRQDRLTESLVTIPVFPFVLDDSRLSTEVQQRFGYIYGTFKPRADLALIGGVSVGDHHERDRIDRTRINPKLGLIWQAHPRVTVRAAAFQHLARNITTNQTLEPVSVAGFSQFYDIGVASRQDHLGFAIDARPSDRVAMGAEVNFVNVEQPRNLGAGSYEFQYDISAISAYSTVFLFDGITIGTSFHFEKTQTDPLVTDINLPDEIEESKLPFEISYFSPNGLFSTIGAEWVQQSVSRSGATTQSTGRDSEVFLNTRFGYRLPKRAGLVSIQARNLLDRKMRYQDMNFIRTLSSRSEIQQGRSVIVRATLHF